MMTLWQPLSSSTPGALLRLSGEASSKEVAAASTRDLAQELLGRLRRGENLEEGSSAVDLLAVLGMEIEYRTDRFSNRFSRERACTMLHKVERHLVARRLRIEGATVVELGCGSTNPWGNLFLHLLAGARRAVGVDLDPPQDPEAAARVLAKLAGYVLADPIAAIGFPLRHEEVAKNLRGFDLARLWSGDPGGIDPERLELLREPAERLSLGDGSVDYVYSMSFLEHVADADDAIAEIARVTRPGGVSVHTIDGTDHLRYDDPSHPPLDFLTKAAGERMFLFTNRIRPLEFEAIWRRHGFEVLETEVHLRLDVPDELRASFVEPFRSMPREILEPASVTMHLQKR